MTKRGDAELRQLIAEHPGMPMIASCPSLPSDYDHYWLDVCGAKVESILKPSDVEKQCGSYFGLSDERYYWDTDDAAEDVSEFVFDVWFEVAKLHGMPYVFGDIPDDALTKFCGAESSIADLAGDVARHIVDDMPWQDHIVIDCF